MRRGSLVALIGVAAAIGCTGVQPEWSDLHDTRLSQMRTFRIDTATPPSGLEGDDARLWEEHRSLVRGLIRTELAARGYREVINRPDFVVRFWGRRGGDYTQKGQPEYLSRVDACA